MDGSYRDKWLRLTVRTLVILVALVASLIIGVLIFGSHLRGPIVRYVTAQYGRQIRVDGPLHAHLLSLHPQFVAERVTIRNPPWTPPGVTAVIGRVSLTYDLPFFGQSSGVRRLEMEQANLYLLRDEAGRANWQLRDPSMGPGSGPPLIRSLRMANARVQLDDERLHLKFEGTVSAQDVPGQGPTPPLRIDGEGQLNGRPARFTLSGDPLATVSAGQPYRFEFTENSSGTRLTGKGVVPHPFDFRVLETTFDSTGEDMKDLYFLTGVHLPDTGTYHLTGKFARQGLHMEFTDLDAASGRSDVRATVSIDSKMNAPSHIEADLRSKFLRVSDLGAQAAGRAPKRENGKRHALPDTPLPLTGVRRSDAVINFHAQTLEAARVTLHSVAAKAKIDGGVMVAAPLSAALQEGKVTGELKLDASRDVPAADLDFRVTNVKLGQFGRKDSQQPPPFDGPLQARITAKGHGSSIHELAANANGTVTGVLPHGALRSSLAELAGLDLRGLGLMAVGDKEDTGIRCGVASFEVKNGIMSAQRLVVDTQPVLISGEGTINLDSEVLDLRFQGRPKHPRLRVRSRLLVRGTLGHPSFSMEAGKPAAQVAGAIALGTLLTPVAAMLAFVDPGLAKDTDCAALLAEAGSEEKK